MLVGFAASSRTLRQALLFIYKLVAHNYDQPINYIELKKFWNIFLLSSIIISVLLTIWIYYLLSNKIYPIKYDTNLDNKELDICNKDIIPQYYGVETDYLGGKRAIKNELLPLINKGKIEFDSKSGFVTIRFVVNCNGEIGLFRVNEINENIKPTEFASSKIEELIKLVATLKNWNVKIKNEESYDSYYFINFKIKKGVITDVF
jgi:hypothetical protein